MKIVNIPQQTEQWFRVRAGRPTASEFSRILTPGGKDSDQWKSYAVELCAECLRPDEIDWSGNYHTDRGNELEPEAISLFEKVMERTVTQPGFVTRDDEVIGCSPDGLVSKPDNSSYIAGLEVKCPTARKHALTLIDKEMPKEHLPQVHGGMVVTGLKFWYFMSYSRGLRPFIKRIERNDYTEKLADALDRFLIYYQDQRKEIMPKLRP